MNIEKLYATQKNLRRKEQIERLIKSIHDGEYIEPVLLSENEDGTIQVENGHHRVIAYYLSGRKELRDFEYILIGETERHRICKLIRLCDVNVAF